MSKSLLPKSARWLLTAFGTLVLGAAIYLVRSGPPAREASAARQPAPSTSPAQPVPPSGDNHREARAASPPQAVALTQVAPPDAPPPGLRPATATAPTAAPAAAPVTVTATAGDLPADFLDRIVAGGAVAFTLPDGRMAAGGIGMSQRDAHGLRFVQGRLSQPAPGFYFFQRQTVPGVAGPLVGHVRFDGKQEAWKIEPTGELGVPRLLARTLDDILCVNYAHPAAAAVAQAAAGGVANAPQTHPTNLPLPSYQSVISLQSLPGATAVIYLDFDGESGPFENWGNFNAAPSGANNSQVFDVWQMVCEDYQGFNINVTTDRMVFDNAPQGRRQHCIITPTNNAAPGAGGVSYVGSFNWDGDCVNWVFSTTGKSAGEVISHEVGHALNLSHDGRTSPAEEYYGGHGSGATGWAPIMGVGYYQNLSQWSKGEYLNANQTQDDLSIIVNNNNEVDYRADDTGEVLATARYLEIASNNTVANEGIIETTGDVDAFRFATAGGLATLNVNTVSLNPNLDIQAELVNAATRAVVASNNPDAAINAVVAATLAAGEYLLRVRGVGRGDPLGDGYTNYGSLGSYLISGSVVGGVKAERFATAENGANGTLVGSVVARNNHAGAPLAYAIASGNSNGAFSINPATGALSVANGALLDFEALSLRWDDPATLELFIAISDAANPALNEILRTVVTVINGYEAPVFTSNPIQFFAARDRPFSAALSATDADPGDTLTYTKVSGPAWLNVAANGTLSGTPASTDAGTNLFVVRATDVAGLFGQTTLNILVAEAAIWLNPAGGSWADAANWLGGASANGAAVTADFTSLDLGADATVTLDGARTLGNLWFGDSAPSHNWTLTSGSAGPLTLDNGASQPLIAVSNSTTTTIGAVLAGSHGFGKQGPGTLVLAAANSYSGTTTIRDGTLNPNHNAAFGTGSLTLSGGTLVPTGGGAYTYANPVVVTAATTTTVFGYGGGGNPAFTGALTGSGTIFVRSDRGSLGNTMIHGDISGFSGTFAYDNSGAGVNFQFQGTTPESRDGSQAHFVSSGATAMAPGLWLFFAGAGNTFKLGELAGPGGHIRGVGANMTFEIGHLNTDTSYAGAIYQDGANPVHVTKVGSGTLTLSGPLDYTGATTVTAGALELAKPATFNSSSIELGAANSPTLKLGTPLVADSWTFASPISGGSASAKIEKTGPGTLVLTPGAGSSFTGTSSGALTVSGGTLYLTAAFTTAPAVSVAAGARFGGSARAGNVTLAHAATLEGGMSGSGTLTAANLTIGSRPADTATLKGTLAGGAGYKPLAVTNLTLNGGNGSVTLDVAGAGLTNGSYYDLLVASNPISAPNASSVVEVFTTNSRAYTPTLDGTGTKLQLYYSADASVYWSGAASGAWNPGASNWKLSGSNVPTKFLANDAVFFHDNPSRATVDISEADVSPLATTFDNSSATAYTVQGNCGIATGAITKTGNGTLTLANTNSTSGPVALNGGITSVASSDSLGSGAISFNGGSLAYTGATVAWARALTVNGGGGSLAITDIGTNLTYTGTLAGAGVLTKTGPGTLTLANASSHAGGMALSGGTLIANDNAAFGTGPLSLSGGTLAVTADRTFANPVVVSAATTTTVNTAKFTAAISGSGTLCFNDSSTGNFGITGDISGFSGTFWYHNSANRMNGGFYDGATAASRDGSRAHFVTSGITAKPTSTPGWWQFIPGAGATFKMGDIAGDGGRITGTFGMTFAIGYLNTSSTYGGIIGENAGVANVVKVGGGTLTLTGANDYTGTTTITQGTLAVSNTAGSGTGSGAVTVQTTATLAGSGSIGGGVSVEAGGFIAPGNAGIATLSVAAAALSGTYQCQLGATSGDQLVISGALTVNPGAAIVVSTLATPVAASYIIAKYGSLTGGLPVVSGIPAGYVLDTATAGQLKLVKSADFSGWAASFPGLLDKTPGGDPDRDGATNLLEYVIGGDPRVSGTSLLPGAAIVGSNLVLSYQRSDASEGDTTQTGQWSTNLSTWHDIAPVLVNENGAAPDSMKITIPLGNAASGKLFGRLHVTQP